jgi:hypothetical protein
VNSANKTGTFKHKQTPNEDMKRKCESQNNTMHNQGKGIVSNQTK